MLVVVFEGDKDVMTELDILGCVISRFLVAFILSSAQLVYMVLVGGVRILSSGRLIGFGILIVFCTRAYERLCLVLIWNCHRINASVRSYVALFFLILDCFECNVDVIYIKLS